MSDELLFKNKAFIDLLLKTKSFEQRQALLDTATPSQIRAISELCLNLLHERAGKIEEGLEREKIVENQELSQIGYGAASFCTKAKLTGKRASTGSNWWSNRERILLISTSSSR